MEDSKGLSRPQIEELIDTWILHERNRKILKRRMCDGIFYGPLSEEFDMSVQQVKNIVYKGKEIIYSHVDK